MDFPPASDFTYAEVFDVENSEGFRDTELDVDNNITDAGIPIYFAGRFSGILTMKSYLSIADIGSTSEKINQIYKRQSNGEKIEAIIFRTYTNRDNSTIVISTLVRVQEMKIIEGETGLLTWQILAKIIKPSAITTP